MNTLQCTVPMISDEVARAAVLPASDGDMTDPDDAYRWIRQNIPLGQSWSRERITMPPAARPGGADN